MTALTLKLLDSEYCICQLDTMSELQSTGFPARFYSITQTDDEISLVCESSFEIKTVRRESGWRLFKIDQILQFEQVGIIAGISAVLKNAQISIFVISTFNTDYLMVKSEMLDKAKQVLFEAGYLKKI